MLFYSKRLNVAVMGVEYKNIRLTAIVDFIDLTGQRPKERVKKQFIARQFVRSFVQN